MLVVTQRVDIQDAISRNQEPVAIIRRRKASDADRGRVPMTSGRTFDSGVWRVSQTRLMADKPMEFSRDLGKSVDGLVRVPLFAYEVSENTAEVLVTLGLQLGALVCLQQPESSQQLTIVQGNVFARTDGQEGYRVWLGFAFRLEKNT